MSEKDPMEFSPFDAPVKDVKPNQSNGIKIERITDSELDGGKKMSTPPTDAPEFIIPDFDKIPNAPGSGSGRGFDPMAPGSSGDPFAPGGSGMGGGTKIDPEFKKEFTEYTAKWLIDMFFKLVVSGFRQFAKIDRNEVLIAIEQGHIDKGFLKYVDESNENVDREINVTEEEKKFIIEPLKYFIEVKKIEIGPGWMVAGSMLMVVVTIAIKAYEVKQQNKTLLDRMIKESSELKKGYAETKRGEDWKRQASADPEVANFTQSTDTFSVEKESTPSSADEVIQIIDPEVIPNEENF